MIKIKQKLKEILIKAIEEIASISLNIEDVDIDIPKKREHGDLSSNIALKLSGQLDMKPYDLGAKVRDKLTDEYDFITDIRVMGPGFINFYLKEEYLIKENLSSIESGDFKKFHTLKKNIKVSVVLNKLSDIVSLQNFRAFMNMYYLGNLYSFAGYKVRKIIVVKENDISIDIKYLLSNFKDIEITLDEKELKNGIVFCSTLSQGLFRDHDNQRFVVEGVRFYKNGLEIHNLNASDLFDMIGFDRVKYTVCNRAINSEMDIELTKDNVRYIQYPYSRIISIIKLFKDEGIDIEETEAFREDLITNSLEKEMIKKILDFKDSIKESINQNQPYRFIRYANELCEVFYKINTSTLYRQLSKEKLIALLKLLNSVKIVLKEILSILELPVYEKM